MTKLATCLTMVLRFASESSPMGTFLADQLSLPTVRSVPGFDIFWAGEASIFEVVYVAGKAAWLATEADRHDAWTPIFRVNGLDRLMDRLSDQGAVFTDILSTPLGREAFLIDPDGMRIGFREAPEDSERPQDVEARRRRIRGETFNPGCRSMPEDIQELGWVTRSVQDVDAMADFYGQVLGLKPVGALAGRRLLDAGDNLILELSPGGRGNTPPSDRYNAPASLIFRVSDMAQVRENLAKAAAVIVNESVALHWADLIYFADPDGAVVGVEQSYHPGVYAPAKFVLPESLEADRRAREAAALGKL